MRRLLTLGLLLIASIALAAPPERPVVRDKSDGIFTFPAFGRPYDVWNNAYTTAVLDYVDTRAIYQSREAAETVTGVKTFSTNPVFNAAAIPPSAISGSLLQAADSPTITGVWTFATPPVIGTITNTGTVTLPTSTDTLVGRATTDTLTNKTLTAPTITGPTITGTVAGGATYTAPTMTAPSLTDPVMSGTVTGTSIFACSDQDNLHLVIVTCPPYNAVGDGVTDAGAAMNAAIVASNSAGGGLVLIPPGTYEIETSLVLRSNVYVSGAGPNATVLHAKTGLNAPVILNATLPTSKTISSLTRSGSTATATTSTAHGFTTGDYVHVAGADEYLNYDGWQLVTVTGVDTFTYTVDKDATTPATGTLVCFKQTEQNFGIRDLRIHGNPSNTAGDNFGIQVKGGENFWIERVHVNGTYHMGIAIISGKHGALTANRVESVIHASHAGFLFGSSSPSTTYADSMSIADSQSNYNGQDGFLLETGHDLKITNSSAFGNGQTGFKSGKFVRLIVQGNYAQNNLTGFKAQAYWNDNVFNDNIARMNKDSGFLFTTFTPLDASGLVVNGNIADNNGNDPTSTSYGIGFEAGADGVGDTIVVTNNIMTNQTRGLSFGTTGTWSHVFIGNNVTRNNTADILLGSSLDRTTATIKSNPAYASAASGDGAYGQSLHRLNFWADDIPASAGTTNFSESAGGHGYVMPKDGYVRLVYGKLNAAVTAGTLTLQVRVNNGGGGIGNNFAITSGQTGSAENTYQSAAFVAGDIITLIYSTSSGFLPSGTDDMVATVEVVY